MTAVYPQSPSDGRRLDLLIDALVDYAIYMLDADGYITSWNTGAERIKGYGSGEILGQHFSRFFSADDRAADLPERILGAARASGRHEEEGWRIRKGGSRFWCNAIIQAVWDEQGTLIGFAKITRDITERVAAHQALLDSERRFRVLVEGVVDYAIYMLDPSGVVTNWNTGAERLKGYTSDEIVGQHFSKFYTKDDRGKGLPARVLDTAAKEGRYESEGWRVRKDGSRFWASVVLDAIRDKAGVLQGFAKITRDITERRAAQEALRESEKQFRLLVAGVTDYALYMLDPNGIVVSWNAGAQHIKGYSADEIIGHHFSRFYPERDRAAGLPARALYKAEQDGRFEAEAWRVRKDGTMFWASVIIDPIRDEKGQLIGFAKITRDITERQVAQEALQEAQEQRAHAQKMDALGQLTGGVAHDFNNLLMVVTGNVTGLQRILGDEPKAVRALRAIEMAAERGAALTRQLLTFSRRQTYNPTVLHLSERIEAIRTMLTSSLGSTVQLTTTVEPDIWPVKLDASELEIALVNLTLNARDAMPQGGSIAIVAENVTLPASDVADLSGDFVALRITDTGTGIAPDVLAKVFDPFFTTKGTDKGNGLGLSQVHGFAHQSGGTVTIDSELGKGTTITLYIPRSEEAIDDGEPEPDVGTVSEGRILLVEDNPEVAHVTMSMLEQLGYQGHLVTDAESALEAMSKQSFDLIISDIVMPGSMDGLALARKIREELSSQPILLITGYSEAAAQTNSEFTIMRKPFQLRELSRVTAHLIAEARQIADSNVVRLRDKRSPKSTPSD
jgi:PAS domain S-box-containing protein